jgi:hypothetical protein
MVAKIRSQLNWSFDPEFSSRFSNLLVSGCSYVWNNSEEHVCSWPHYLQKIAGFDRVLDCSQSGAGSNHIFNSIINEIETNPTVTKENTLVIVMWSGLERTDVIAESEITRTWHDMSNYAFDKKHSTLSLFRESKPSNDSISRLCYDYHKLISAKSQIYQSYINIIALAHYLRSRNFSYLFLNWEKIDQQFNPAITLYNQARGFVDPLTTLGEFANNNNMRIPNDGHPDTECHLQWCRQILIPSLQSRGFIEE